jgi:hypothetical protein
LENVISTHYTKDFHENNGSNLLGFNSFEICQIFTRSSQNIEQFFFLKVATYASFSKQVSNKCKALEWGHS